MEFIGRDKERKIIKELLANDEFVSILIYGRKRVGKSELIKKSISENTKQAIYFECKQTTEMNNVESLSNLISETLGLPKLAFSNIEEVLDFIFKKSLKESFIFVLDEYSYLRDRVVGLDSILQSFIDRYQNQAKLKFILCGSYVDIMQSLVYVHNPLYGRFSRIIDLKQMDYYDSSLFYKEFSNEDKVRLYSVFGGIPYYNKLVDSSKSVKENIIDLIASPGARLEMEVSMYLKSEISKIVNANEVLETMAMGYSRYSDIFEKSHVSSRPTLVDVLEKLIRMEVVIKEAPINDENNKKKSGYYISDNLSYFYYKYVFRYLSQMNIMDSNTFYDTYIHDSFETQYVPLMFEKVCRQYLIRMNRKGKLETPFFKIGKYYYDDPVHKRNGEFDLVSEDQHGYIFYECKFKSSEVSKSIIDTEIKQVEATGLQCYKYGFFSKSGFEEVKDDRLILVHLDDVFSF